MKHSFAANLPSECNWPSDSVVSASLKRVAQTEIEPYHPLVSRPEDLRALYDKCVSEERKLRSWNLSALKKRLISTVAFRTRFPIPTSHVVNVLKKAKDNDEFFWFVLACWLSEEGVREPEDFLPPAIYSRLTQTARQYVKGISFNDMKLFEFVRCWEPYFEALLEDKKDLVKRHRTSPADVQKELSAAAYEPEAIELVMRKRRRSTVELTCEWVAGRGIIPAKTRDPDPVRTLRNAYSRIARNPSRNAKKAK